MNSGLGGFGDKIYSICRPGPGGLKKGCGVGLGGAEWEGEGVRSGGAEWGGKGVRSGKGYRATKPPEPTQPTEPTDSIDRAACANPACRGDFADRAEQAT